EAPLDDIDECHVRLTQPRTTLHDGVQSRLLIRGGAADHVQDGTRCGLSLQRLLGLIEEAHVLHRDRGLVGERLDHLKLAFVEWLRQVVHHAEDTDRLAVTHERRRQTRAWAILREVGMVSSVSDVLALSGQQRATDDRLVRYRDPGASHHRRREHWPVLGQHDGLIALTHGYRC